MGEKMESGSKNVDEAGECTPDVAQGSGEEGTRSAKNRVSDLIGMFQGLEKERPGIPTDFGIDLGPGLPRTVVSQSQHTCAGDSGGNRRECDLQEAFGEEDNELGESTSYLAPSEGYTSSEPSDPFSNQLDERHEHLFSDRDVALVSPFETRDECESVNDFGKSDSSSEVDLSENSRSPGSPPPLPPRTCEYGSTAARTSVPSESHYTRASSRSQHTVHTRLHSALGAAPVERDAHSSATPTHRTTGQVRINDSKLHNVEIQIPDIPDFNRSVPLSKVFSNKAIPVGRGTVAMDICGDHMCTIGQSVKVFHLPTADLVLNFGISPRQMGSVDIQDQKPATAISQSSDTQECFPSLGLQKRIISQGKSKLSREKEFCIYKVPIPNNDLRNLRLVTGNCISAPVHNKSTSSSQVKREKPTSVSFLHFKDITHSGRFLLVGTDKGSIICADLDLNCFGQLKSDNPHTNELVIITAVGDKLCFFDESGFVSVWWFHDYIITFIHKFKLPTADNYLKNNSVKHISAHVNAKRLNVALGKHMIYVSIDKPTAPTFVTNSCKELGSITSITSCRDEHILASHNDGKISVWDLTTVALLKVITLGSYSIGSILGIRGEDLVWVGMRTGRIYVYKTVFSESDHKWILVNSFHAYKSSPISSIRDNRKLLLLNGVHQIATLCDCGIVKFWDGFLSDNVLRSLLDSREDKYCTYKQLKFLICSWNVDAARPKDIMSSDGDLFGSWLSSADSPDVVVICIQEIVDLESARINARGLLSKSSRWSNAPLSGKNSEVISLWKKAIGDAICTEKSGLKLIEVVEMVGLFQAVFAKKADSKVIKNVALTHVKTGLKGYYGNKGAVALRFRVDDTSICLINCHLSAHQNQVSSRNKDVHYIVKYARFPKDPEGSLAYVNGSDGTLITDHEVIFWSGDLNYRINMDRDRVIQLIEIRDWQSLIKCEQLTLQRNTLPGFALRSFSEGNLNFPPTFKYDVGSDCYDTSDKGRIPSWCDRILYYGKKVEQQMYKRFEIRASDHRPIAASFTVTVKKVENNLLSREMDESKKIMSEFLSRRIKNERVSWLSDTFMLPTPSCEKLLDENNGDVLLAARHIQDIQSSPSIKTKAGSMLKE